MLFELYFELVLNRETRTRAIISFSFHVASDMQQITEKIIMILSYEEQPTVISVKIFASMARRCKLFDF